MSSAVYITFNIPILIEEWENFCKEHEIIFSPHTVGSNVFYRGKVQVVFGNPTWKESIGFKQGEFPEKCIQKAAEGITVSSYWGTNLDKIAKVAKEIKTMWNPRIKYIRMDPEMEPICGDLKCGEQEDEEE